ncbi:MAG: helix-turn-helix transcriptional regulator [Eggerthellaceae bacterium]
MPRENQKLKLLYLAKIFQEETDGKVGLTMPQIIEHLREYGISAERKALYRDIKALREFGMDIRRYNRSPMQYALANREFSQPELLLLVDAVQSSRFLDIEKSRELIDSIRTLASKRQREALSKRMHVEGRIKMQNESVFYNVDIVQEAIQAHHKVSFHYFKYDVEKKKERQHGGDRYLESPVELIYSDGYYYLVAYNDKHDDFTNYRVDRMTEVMVSDEPATRNERIALFDPEAYTAQAFSMFNGEPKTISLIVDGDVMSSIVDRFGSDVESHALDESHARVYARVKVSDVFYGWLAQFGTKVRVEKPQSVVQGYTDYLQRIVDAYREGGAAGGAGR